MSTMKETRPIKKHPVWSAFSVRCAIITPITNRYIIQYNQSQDVIVPDALAVS